MYFQQKDLDMLHCKYYLKVTFAMLFFSQAFLTVGIGQLSNTDNAIISNFKQISAIPFNDYVNDQRDIILISELHNVSCTYEILEHVIQQNLQRGFGHIIQEMPFSYSIVCNAFVETGDTTLLNLISSSEEAKYFFRRIRQLSMQTAANTKPHFWGIDFELGASRIKYLKAAMSILLTKYSFDKKVQQILGEIKNKESVEEIQVLNNELKLHLDLVVGDNKESYDEGLALLQMIANRNTEYVKHRDSQLYQNFLEIDRLVRMKENRPKYIGSFGLAHINTALKNSFSRILLNDHNWTARTSIIGTQYYRCESNYGLKKTTTISEIGVLPNSISKLVQNEIENIQSPSVFVLKPTPNSKIKRVLDYSLVLVLVNYPGESINTQRIYE